ncbi:MAG: hypothetical protein LUE11_00855 [Clostridia bacterium]|nr:hypothetical protein [Clostridia bacterium]
MIKLTLGKKSVTAMAIALLLCLEMVLCGCGRQEPEAGRTIAQSEQYSGEEISAAMDVVEDYFHENFTGCTNLKLSYADSYCDGEDIEQYEGDALIILDSSFDVDENGGDGSFAPNSTQEGWKWVLTRSNGGAWKIQNYGYA